MSEMGNIKVSHKGGDSKRMPTSGATHKLQKPGNADKNTSSTMKWNGSKK